MCVPCVLRSLGWSSVCTDECACVLRLYVHCAWRLERNKKADAFSSKDAMKQSRLSSLTGQLVHLRNTGFSYLSAREGEEYRLASCF